MYAYMTKTSECERDSPVCAWNLARHSVVGEKKVAQQLPRRLWRRVVAIRGPPKHISGMLTVRLINNRHDSSPLEGGGERGPVVAVKK
jgi:hypothetical protein